MKNKNKLFHLIFSILCLSGLLLFCSPSLAEDQCREVESILTLGVESDDWKAAGNDGALPLRIGEIEWGAAGNYICFPTSIKFNDVDGDTEYVSCKVSIDQGNQEWVLEATSLSDPEVTLDGDAWCRAQCFKWDNQ